MKHTPPDFLLKKPEPTINHRLYNGQKIQVWEGRVKIADIIGWVDNPRMELIRKEFQEKLGHRALTQDEVYDIMKTEPEMRLKELRDDIMKNGLRRPITLSYEGKLLDGNRRFFAARYALDSLPKTDPNRRDLETIDAYVLNEDATTADEDNVLVEENFAPSLKIEWPDYVKARHVVEAKAEGLKPSEIAEKFNWPKTKVAETLRIHEIIEEFMAFATSPPNPDDEFGGGIGLSELQATAVAARNYQFFNEAQKSFYDPLRADLPFKIQFFKWIQQSKFASFPEVRIAYKAWKDPEARSIIMQSEPTAAKAAKATLDYNERVVRTSEETVGRIDSFVKFLKGLRVDDIKALPAKTRENLAEALDLVQKMSRAAATEERKDRGT